LFNTRYPILVSLTGPSPLVQGRNLHGLALVVGGLIGACAGGYVLIMVLGAAVSRVRAIIYARMFARANRVIEK
jgi:hypothetical protein